ncbi:MAG: dTMP kinase [Candidatus Paracaedibacteraceae bacterium]|nr:dTMP kinase [Candidatus Paracaedibacteraceae bacterium]
MTAGHFITFEGGEGTGKSTQCQLLAEYLRLKEKEVILTREPGGTDGAELIRALLVSGDINRWSGVTEALLLNAARVDHWDKVISPALNRGAWVICDRFADSTIAYQGYGRGLDINFLWNMHNSVLPGIYPELTLVFDLDPEIGISRALARRTSEVRFEKMDIEFHRRMREGYLEIAKNNPERCRVIDAHQGIEEIHSTIKGLVESFS